MKRIRSEHIALERLKAWEIAETLLPEYSEPQYKDLEEFLANGGQLAPITIAEDGRIVDGYNRWRTAKRLNLDEVECDIYSYDDPSEMEIHAIVLNSKRRHLNRLQVARAAARLADLLPPAEPETEPMSQDETAGAADNDPQNPDALASAPSQKAPRPDQAVRTVSHKLGVLPSTVRQVSKVDKSGDKRLIAAMEDKTISIRQAAEIADMEEEQRFQAIESIDGEKKKKNDDAEVFSRTCNDCLRKLQSCEKKISGAEFSDSERREMRSSVTRVIGEANWLIKILSGEARAGEDSEKPKDDGDAEA